DPTFDGDGQHLNGGSAVIDAASGRIHLFFNRLERIGAATTNDLHDYYIFSDDNGYHWGSNAPANDGIPRAITASIKIDGQGNPPGSSLPNYVVTDAWGSDTPGPGPGIQLRNGPHAGRLILPRNHRYGPGSTTPYDHVIYSDDNGATWQLGGGPDES